MATSPPHRLTRLTRRAAAVALAATLPLTAWVTLAAPSAAAKVTAPTTTKPCGRTTSVPRYRHVVWIVMENYGYADVTNATAAPFLSRLAHQCGLATNYRAISHPSLPNYVALTAGSTEGISDDNEPSSHPLDVPNIFWQLNGDWHALEESMPSACDRVTSGSYAARHDPAVYYTNLGSACGRDVVPLSYPLNLSSAFTFITPNICDDMHNCPVSTGDAWLARNVALIEKSAAYRSGTTALFVTWDESDTGANNQVATYVVAPSVRPGTRAGANFNAYSLLHTTEQLLHVRALAGAKTAPSMLAAFHL